MRTAVGFVVGMTGWVMLVNLTGPTWSLLHVFAGMMIYLSGGLLVAPVLPPDK